MSKNELGRVEVLARVKSKQLRVVDAALLLRVSYRQAKRLWKLYREEGAAGLKHRSVGRPSNRGYEAKFRRKVLRLVREKYSGAVGERFGPTLTTEHLESEDDLKVMRRRCGGGCWRKGCGVASGSGGGTGNGARARTTLVSWCRWMAAFTRGWKSADRRAA